MNQFTWLTFMLLGTTLLSLFGCGTMEVKETHYYAVESEYNTNIFRLQIKANSSLGDAKYLSGYYPAYAVDRAFGDVRNNGGAAELQAQEAIADNIRKAIVKTTQDYLAVASSHEATEEQIQKALRARRNVLAYPSLKVGIPTNARIIDYDPSLGIVTRNGNSKMVFVFSSNPDNVIGNIKNFAESDQTALAVSKLAQVTSQQTRNDVAESEAQLSIMQQGTKGQIDGVIKTLTTDKDAVKIKIEDQLTILRAYLEGL